MARRYVARSDVLPVTGLGGGAHGEPGLYYADGVAWRLVVGGGYVSWTDASGTLGGRLQLEAASCSDVCLRLGTRAAEACVWVTSPGAQRAEWV